MTSSHTADAATFSWARISVSPAPKQQQPQSPQPMEPSTPEVAGDGNIMDRDAFTLPPCRIPPKKDLEPVEVFVTDAVTASSGKKYNSLIEAFRFKKDLNILYKIIVALRTTGMVNIITSAPKKHGRLIHFIVRMDPFTEEQQDETDDTLYLADAYFHLITALVSANSVFCVPVLISLWKQNTVNKGHVPPSQHSRIHACMATIFRLIPKAKTELISIVTSHVPFRMRPEPELVWYFQQSLYIAKYMPSIQLKVLELIIHTCLELDVEIKITDMGTAVRDDEDKEGKEENDKDADETTLPNENNSPTPSAGEPATTLVDVDGMADRLDSLMLILFQHIRTSNLPEVFDHLTTFFECSIMNTHKSKYVQFLLLYICGLDAQQSSQLLYRNFAARLIDIVLDPYRATAVRQSGSCYLASFVSRGSFICAETCCESIDALMRWAEAYIESLGEYSVLAADARKQCSMHSLFYTICQSAFYIMCFRGADVVKCMSGSDLGFEINTARWTKLCSHSLNPLKYCLESVRIEFLWISGLFNLLESDTLQSLRKEAEASDSKSRRKRLSLISTPATLERERICGGVGGLGRGTNPLDSFFPFDPYLLMRSHECIESFYKHWDGGIQFQNLDRNGDDEASVAYRDKSLHTVDQESVVSELDKPDQADDDDASVPNETSARRKRLMSIASNATSVSSHPEVRVVWETEFKKPRALSIENGSW